MSDQEEAAHKKSEAKEEAEKPTNLETAETAAPDAPVATAAAKGDADDDDDDAAGDVGDAEGGDLASPEAVAKRLDALGGAEDESDRIARAEEKKLLERKAKSKKGKKGGLEKAASKRLSDIGKRAEPKRAVATAVDISDPLMVRTQKFGQWAKDNQKTVTIAGLAVVALLLGAAGMNYRDHTQELEASVALAQGVSDERGQVGEPPKEDEERRTPRPLFKTADERREAALKSYKDVESRFPKTGAAILARLSEGSILLDKRDPDGAAAAFTDVKSSPLAVADAEVRGRAMEGLGFAYELKATMTPADATKNLDEAIKVYKEMEIGVDVKGFKELAMYHQARCLQTKGDKDAAKTLLVSVRERVSKPGENHPFPYLEEVASDRLRSIDPTAVPPKPSGNMSGATGPQMNEAQLKQLIDRLKKQQEQHGGDDHGGGAPHP